MVAGIYIADQDGNVIFDGSQRIPKVLAKVEIKRGDVSKSVTLPKPIEGELFYYFSSDEPDNNPYGTPLVYNFSVSVSGTTATVTYEVVYQAMPTFGGNFTVYIGEY
ncbi:hypothetical protein KPC_0312 [Acinetobacter stercoris]|uniref:Uncharacterized protein n=1 Tax=Acinetobacter stercoris TaxID=2126983 RepID=A0A2U3MUQ9_9GAMM|nr:hypothetical protein KPC_0312 [Acinetobacter stercoris]